MSRAVHALTLLTACVALAACPNEEAERAQARAVAERVAQDTAGRAWSHRVGVDSVLSRSDTLIVWVSPRDWMATDAPQAGVRVGPDGRVKAIQWVHGG